MSRARSWAQEALNTWLGSGDPLDPKVLAAWQAALERACSRVSPGPGAPEDFGDYAKARLRLGEIAASPAEQGASRLEDLYLAWRCVKGDAKAQAAFDRELLRPGTQVVQRLLGSHDDVDEVMQLLRAKLFGADDQEPQIAQYEGRGPLLHWVRAAALRAAQSLLRRKKRRERLAHDDEPLEGASVALDPELGAIKERLRHEFSAAFKAAVDALTRQERAVLRLHVAEELTLDEVAAHFGVHRATVVRWVAAARVKLVEFMRRELAPVWTGELEALVTLVRSQLDVSIREQLDKPRP